MTPDTTTIYADDANRAVIQRRACDESALENPRRQPWYAGKCAACDHALISHGSRGCSYTLPFGECECERAFERLAYVEGILELHSADGPLLLVATRHLPDTPHTTTPGSETETVAATDLPTARALLQERYCDKSVPRASSQWPRRLLAAPCGACNHAIDSHGPHGCLSCGCQRILGQLAYAEGIVAYMAHCDPANSARDGWWLIPEAPAQ